MAPGPNRESTSSATVPIPESRAARHGPRTGYAEWTDQRRDAELDALVTGYSPDQLRAAIRPRLRDLSKGDAEPLLRLVEGLATSDLLQDLAEAVTAQPGLAPEQAWPALALLDEAGILGNYPGLRETWEELNEIFADESSLDQLAAQIEDDPEGLWLALQGLAAVEPEVRAEIIAGLSGLEETPGPRMIEFLRLLSFAHDPSTRTAAVEALCSLRPPGGDPQLDQALRIIAAEHADPAVSERALRRLGTHERGRGTLVRSAGELGPRPMRVRSLVTALDGNGQGTIVLAADHGGRRVSAAFLCDVQRGLPDVFGKTSNTGDASGADADSLLEEIAGDCARPLVRDASTLAEGLLRACLLLCGPETPPALAYWIEATLGPGMQPRPFPIPFPGWDPASLVPEEMAERAERVLAACPDWIDTSPLTHDIAEEILLREGDSPPDPRRDQGAFRYLFEHHLRSRLELYRRMLFWMASFWQASGDDDRGRSALALATQLSDEQHEVPGHPFTVALTCRSLAAAQRQIRTGAAPRRRPPDA